MNLTARQSEIVKNWILTVLVLSYYALCFGYVVLLLSGCESPAPWKPISVIPDVRTNEVAPSFIKQRIAKTIEAHTVMAAPSAAVVPAAPALPRKFFLEWDAKLFGKTIPLPYTNGTGGRRLMFVVETKTALAAPWKLHATTNFNRLEIKPTLARAYFRVGERWE